MIRAAALVVASGLLAACGAAEEKPTSVPATTATPPSESSPSPSPTPTRTASAPARTGTVVITARSKYGTMLYDASGQPIYLFGKETGTKPQCYGACAEAWPPVLTRGLPRATRGTREALLGTTRRTDGRLQVTYAGHPLYFYAHEGRYQVTCHDVVEYGGRWLVVRPDGRPVSG